MLTKEQIDILNPDISISLISRSSLFWRQRIWLLFFTICHRLKK